MSPVIYVCLSDQATMISHTQASCVYGVSNGVRVVCGCDGPCRSEAGYVATAVIFILAGVKSEVKISALIQSFAADSDHQVTATAWHLLSSLPPRLCGSEP